LLRLRQLADPRNDSTMMDIPVYFKLEEIVCPHVYNTYGEAAWSFFDPRLIETLEKIRERINRPIMINNWKEGGQYSQRGFRCIKCELVQDAIRDGRLYVSPHMTGQGVDFDVQGMVAEEVRQWIIKNQNILPWPVRMEAGVSWVHMDVRGKDDKKVYLFAA